MPEPTYKRKTVLPPLALSTDELIATISLPRNLTRDANAGSSAESTESLSLGTPSGEVSLATEFVLDKLKEFPDRVFYSLRYHYQCTSAAVGSIYLLLDDSTRAVIVEGRSNAQVQAISYTVVHALREHRVVLGGATLRLALGAPFQCALLLAGLTPLLYVSATGRSMGTDVSISLIAGILLFNVCMYALPWQRWLPGFAVHRNDASFMARNSAAIGFWSFVLGLVSLVITLVAVGA